MPTLLLERNVSEEVDPSLLLASSTHTPTQPTLVEEIDLADRETGVSPNPNRLLWLTGRVVRVGSFVYFGAAETQKQLLTVLVPGLVKASLGLEEDSQAALEIDRLASIAYSAAQLENPALQGLQLSLGLVSKAMNKLKTDKQE